MYTFVCFERHLSGQVSLTGQVKLSGRRSLASCCWMLNESVPRTGVTTLPNKQPPGVTTVWKFFKQTLK